MSKAMNSPTKPSGPSAQSLQAQTLGTLVMITALIVSIPSGAAAGGFYIADRGVSPLGRGGALVAGADDPHAMWYNPAGLSYSGDQLVLDATLSIFSVDYTRIDSGGRTLPTVTGQHAMLPIPTIAASFDFDALPDFTFGLALMAPNSALMEWPDAVDMDGAEGPAPQRYSLLSMEGSTLAMLSLAAAWQPIDEFSVGLTASLLVGTFSTQVALTACDNLLCAFPEDPEYDAIAQLTLPIAYPFFTLGAIYDAGFMRIGASVATPFSLEGSAQIQVRPPSAAAFDGATSVNHRSDCNWEDPAAPCRTDTRADVAIPFPWILRLGVEFRPTDNLRIETAAVWETWSVQQEATINPDNVWLEDTLGFLNYQVGPMSVPRNMKDTVSIRLGGTYSINEMFTVRLGGYFENGSFDDEYLSVLTIDSDKLVFGGGLGVQVSPEVRIDAVAGYIWMFSREVRNSRVPQSNPIRPSLPEANGDMRSVGDPVYIGNGDYSITSPYFGLGMNWRFDAGPAPVEDEEAPSPEASDDV